MFQEEREPEELSAAVEQIHAGRNVRS